jgi:hypothetical protein
MMLVWFQSAFVRVYQRPKSLSLFSQPPTPTRSSKKGGAGFSLQRRL